MSDSKDRNNVVVSCGSGWDGFFIALVIWVTMFYGEPDIVDAIIHYLMNAR